MDKPFDGWLSEHRIERVCLALREIVAELLRLVGHEGAADRLNRFQRLQHFQGRGSRVGLTPHVNGFGAKLLQEPAARR